MIEVMVLSEAIELPEGVEEPTLEQIVDADIEKFREYFCGELGNDSLSAPERSIIKTYLWWKTHQKDPNVEEDRNTDNV